MSCCGNSPFDYFARNLFQTYPLGSFAPATYRPIKVNVRDAGDVVYVEAELPGFEKEDISILLADTTLSISAEKKVSQEEEQKEGYVYKEYSHSKFQRSVLLPFEADAEKIKAYYNAGILRIDIPKDSDAPPSTEIEIN